MEDAWCATKPLQRAETIVITESQDDEDGSRADVSTKEVLTLLGDIERLREERDAWKKQCEKYVEEIKELQEQNYTNPRAMQELLSAPLVPSLKQPTKRRRTAKHKEKRVCKCFDGPAVVVDAKGKPICTCNT